MKDGEIVRSERRKRSWYRRQLRMQRILVAVVVGVLLAGAFWQNATRYGLFSGRSPQVSSESFWNRSKSHRNLALINERPSFKSPKSLTRIPGIYPYSIIPGGVKNLDGLRSAASRDNVIRRHYAHFDYDHAHLVRASEAREVFLSYRIRDSVFWTQRKIRLHVGELLLTDGKITARARCGNQVSDTAKPEISNEEPAEDVLDQPVAMMESPSMPILPGLGPAELPIGPPPPPGVYANNLIFPYAPMGVQFPPRICPANEVAVDGKCPPKHHKPVAPEPPTLLLVASGLTLILWRYRSSLRHTA